MRVDEIPVAHTPPGGWTEMPPPILAGCDDPLVAGAPDLRGLWRVVSVEPLIERMLDHVERIEQAGDRIVVTANGVVHDMRCDGTEANGVHDVAAANGQEIHVVATYEDGVHTLRPVGMPDIVVTRHLDGDQLVWAYGPMFTARLERIA